MRLALAVGAAGLFACGTTPVAPAPVERLALSCDEAAGARTLLAIENTTEPLPIDPVDGPSARAEAMPLDRSIVTLR